ncbi:hypothetical protein ASPZODRAFT_155173 [Penicilliopsis zonata CBS 506.65]|uniref:MOSC domain-containing protein n=1 Tax=Penicilliopsis zonata CBS 506.65 TaxID=1073090 RepID=A0A1L9S6C9_9EURO|nr:hypothetical protein ASPZODRAFT_155173 [Penicilliopsis zonata CBS 506.65]OJJ42710.1 hypothetical protein ASPZODRAFT_155173 [Penicilliopsis zonata CBS 506.65]
MSWDISDAVTQAKSVPAVYYLALNPPRGCRRLGLSPGKSNLRDEYHQRYSQGVPGDRVDESGLPAWRVKALFAYPIKSCAGMELEVADLVSTGLAYDRQFCFAEYVIPANRNSTNNNNSDSDDPKKKPHWDFRTLRDGRFSRMTLIKPEIWVPDPAASGYAADLEEVKSRGVMIVRYPRVPPQGIWRMPVQLGIRLGLVASEASFRVPLFPLAEDIDRGLYPSLPVRIWKDFPKSFNYIHHIPQSLRDFLAPEASSTAERRTLALFRVNPQHHREIFRCAPSTEEVGFQTVTGFADAYPLHILSLASVHDVAARCAADIPRLTARRFRANLIIQGPAAFAEDAWKRIRVGSQAAGLEIYTVCRTLRCRLPNVDPDTGIRHRSEPDRTMKSYRRIDPGDPTNACLGMQAVPAVQESTIRVNDAVTVLETGEHYYIKMLAPGETIPGEH